MDRHAHSVGDLYFKIDFLENNTSTENSFDYFLYIE